MSPTFLFYNLKQLETMFIMFGTQYHENSKQIRNFDIARKYISKRIRILFSSGCMGGSEKNHGMIRSITDDWRIPVDISLETSNTDWWQTFLTEHEVTNKVTFSAVCAVPGLTLPWRLSTEPAILKYFSNLWKLRSFSNSYLEFFQ